MTINYDPSALEADAGTWQTVSEKLTKAGSAIDESAAPVGGLPSGFVSAYQNSHRRLVELLGQGAQATHAGAEALRLAIQDFNAAEQDASDASNALRFEEDR